jgi:WD40 repeat protein
MRVLGFLIGFVVLLLNGTASAQDGKGWLGADVADVTRAEADKLGWDVPHGAKLGVVASGSPAEQAGLKTGDIMLTIDGVEAETSSAFDKAIAAKSPGAEVLLRVLSNGRERRVTVTLAERPKAQAGRDEALPLLMLNTGGHMALIESLTFTPDGKQVVTASVDKLIRVWDWQTGQTIRTFRGQVGPGHEGKIYTMALSPDGRWLAAGGWMHQQCRGRCGEVRLYDFAAGKLVALLKGHTDVVDSLAFSPDSKQLVAGGGFGDPTAIIWDVESRQLVRRLVGHKNEIYSVAFTPDGTRVVTGSYDTTVKIWSVADGKEIATLTGHNAKVFRVAVSPVDGTIASGSDNGEIRLWDGRTGAPIRNWMQPGSNPASLTFSPDGKRLLSGTGSYATDHHVHVWDVATGKEILVYAKHDNIVVAAAISPDGKLVATGGFNGDVQIWDLQTGVTKRVLRGDGAANWAVAFSRDNQRIAWGTISRYSAHNDRGPLTLQLRLPNANEALGRPEPLAAADAKNFFHARATYEGYALTHRPGGTYGYSDAVLDLKKDGQTLASIERGYSDGYEHRGYSFTPDGQTFVSAGNNGTITAYDLQGKRIGDFVGHESDVWAATPSPDGRLLVSASADQTIRLWNLKTHELIVTLFNGTDGEWVMWTPQGYYTGSPGADKIVGWQINKAYDQLPDHVGADQLRQHLNRPDIVQRAIILGSARGAVREAPGTTFKLADLLARPVPRFKIMSPGADEVQRGGRAVVRITIEATPDPVKAIRVQVNGRQIKELTADGDSGGFRKGEQLLDVPLANGNNEVRITLTNAIGEKAETISISHKGDGDLDKRGTLYIIAVGVDKYPGLGNSCGEDHHASCDLRYSGADAQALVEVAEKRLGPSHTNVVTRLLINGAPVADTPTASNILDAIDLLKQSTETDTVILFIAGHGLNDGPNYRFLATNAEWDGSVLRGSTVVPWYAVQEAVETAKGRRILLIDTCHSGNAYNQRLGNAAYHANIIAYTAARFDQEALEDTKLGHGLFTYALIEGLGGKGGLEAKRQISTRLLAEYVTRRVEELAKALKGEQEPQYFKGRDAEDYVLARW